MAVLLSAHRGRSDHGPLASRAVQKARTPGEILIKAIQSNSLWPSLKPIKIGAGCRVAQFPAHGGNLAFVMKSVSQNMMENKRGSADGVVSVCELKFRICVELSIRQARQVRLRPRPDFLLQDSGIGDSIVLSGFAIDITEPLERINPKPFTVENMSYLLTQRGKAEIWQNSPIVDERDSRQMVE